ncbi:MAG TPA: penicillin-binding protein 2 [Methylophilaceae bacterium]|jgi:penicillin-binding protein 2|nr:penicillin-binding protein 2 [Methylophilaceae bacterium]
MDKYYVKFILTNRLKFMLNFFMLIFLLIIARFFYIQILQHQYYETQANSNSIKLLPITPSRGMIFDRNGVILAENYLSYNLEINPKKITDLEGLVNQLNNVVFISSDDITKYKRILKDKEFSETIPIKSDLTIEEVAIFSANKYRFENIDLTEKLKRGYPLGALGSHFIGYINRINKNDLISLEKNNQLSNYRGTDHIGKSGVEYQYESKIHGKSGYKKIEVNATGNTITTLEKFPSVEGSNLYLTIDIEMQEIAEKAFANKRGALVAINVQNGEILTYVSMPNFDPNLFIDGINHHDWDRLNNSKDKPLLDRVINGLYPPGSTIKPFVAVAGLENQLRLPPYSINDPGYYSVNNSRPFRDWKRDGHGAVDIIKAIAVSCDTFFYGLAVELGIPKLNEALKTFGFGQKTGIDLPNEKSGLLADAQWKKERFNQKWYVGETAITGIGQGFTQVTPLQLALATARISSPNTPITPHLLLNSQQLQQGFNITSPLAISEKTIAWVKEGMENVTEDGGTAAFVGNNSKYKIAAKTGTAQLFGLKKGEVYNENLIDERLRDHALFIAYAPADQPKIAIAVIVENGGHGGSVAGPIAKKIFDYYLTSELKP